jgi:hypothetical protein
VWGLQRRLLDAIIPKAVGGSDNLRPQGSPRPRAAARVLPTSGSSPVQVQVDPQGSDGRGEWHQRALCVDARRHGHLAVQGAAFDRVVPWGRLWNGGTPYRAD